MKSNVKKIYLLDMGILIPYLFLSLVGLLMVYSTTSYVLLKDGQSPEKQAMLQLVYWIASLFLIIIIYKMKLSVFRSRNLLLFCSLLISFLLILVYAFAPINGAYGWIQLGTFGTIQPVEFLKFLVIWFLSFFIALRQKHIQTNFFKSVSGPVIIVGIQIFIVCFYPDLGNAAVIVLITTVILLSSGIHYLWSIIFSFLGIIMSFLSVLIVNSPLGSAILPPHVISRFSVFTNPFADEYGNGFQLVNGFYALFNGGLWGRGLGNSIQKKGFLQFAHTDFAFTILIEELGLISGIFVIGTLFYMIGKIFLIGIRAKDDFNSLMSIGIASLFLISVLINLGGVTGLIPLTGITFPFISQGGSSLLMFSICIGISLNISANEKKIE